MKRLMKISNDVGKKTERVRPPGPILGGIPQRLKKVGDSTQRISLRRDPLLEVFGIRFNRRVMEWIGTAPLIERADQVSPIRDSRQTLPGQ